MNYVDRVQSFYRNGNFVMCSYIELPSPLVEGLCGMSLSASTDQEEQIPTFPQI